jgi:long-chain acyl-CoA synthetase
MVNKTLPQAFFESAAKHGRKKALRYNKGGVHYHISYSGLEKKIRVFAAGLSELGVRQGDNLAILSKNCSQWVIFDLGIMLLGSVTVPIHSTLSPKIIAYILNHSESQILVVNGSELLNKVLLVQDELKFLKQIIYIGEEAADIESLSKIEIVRWNEVVARGRGKDILQVEVKATDVCSIIYTSGTTGLPKGVCLTHENFLSDVEAVSKAIPAFTSDLFLSFLPLSHVLERTAGYYVPLLSGASIAYAEGIKQLPKNLKEFKPTILVCVPRVLEKFHDGIYDKMKGGPKVIRNLFFYALKQREGSLALIFLDKIVFRKIRSKLGGNLRLIVSGGAPLNIKIFKFFKKIGLTVLEGYGLTETAPVLAVNSFEACKAGTVGHPVSGVEIKINPDHEVLVRGPMIMPGYYNSPEETNKAIDQEGWLYTGDSGFIDAEGFLAIIGRKKEMMVSSGGKNIWPEPIELLLNSNKFVSQSIVMGDKRNFVSALIVPHWQEVKRVLQSDQTPEELIKSDLLRELMGQEIENINKNLSEYERVRKFVLLPFEFTEARDELTPTLKLRRHVIIGNHLKEIESMYE